MLINWDIVDKREGIIGVIAGIFLALAILGPHILQEITIGMLRQIIKRQFKVRGHKNY